ncbi:putative mitochondrial protein [Trifolium repens]|nr:putative mitochondrial protein [Trifolium repens]
MTSENSSFVQPSIPRFDGHYDHWSMLMENFLKSKEYWTLVESGITVPGNESALTETQKKALDDQRLKDLKAKNYLFQAIDRAVLETILKKDTAKDIWDSMKKKYQGTARVKRAQLQALRKEFEILHMKEGESVNDYFSRTLSIANKMRINGDKLEDVAVIEKILRSMTRKFDYVVCSIEESNDIDSLSIDELQSSLLVHEQRMVSYVVEEQALKVTAHKGTISPGRGRGGFRGRGRGRGRQFYNRDAQFDMSRVECYHCHKHGHYQYDCPAKEKETKVHFSETEEELLLMAYIDKDNSLGNTWYLDSGCSNHMCGNKSWFYDLDETFRETVKLGNNSCISVMGKGDIKFHGKNNIIHTISSVFYIPDLKSNLISMGQLQDKGYIIIIQQRKCQIHHPEKGLIAEAEMTSNRMFPLHIQHSVHKCFSTRVQDPTWLWHLRYGHLSFKGLKTLYEKNMVEGLPNINNPIEMCEDCIIGKQHRDSFPQGKAWRAEKILQLLHLDICGPINPTSNGNKRYFITFIDDYSRKIWVYFLQEKSEAFNVFKSFKVRVEKESGKCIQTLRTDRGGEFNSHDFASFCESHGIRRQLTAAYTPQQNGVAERKNRTIMNMVRSMMVKRGIPKTFWAEAVNWSVHILNRSPTLAVKNITPQEAWSNVRPSVDHFKNFGCVAYVHVPNEKRIKLDDKSVKSVFIGVSEESKAYRLYNPITEKIIISRDVLFDEENTLDWSSTEKQQTLIDADEVGETSQDSESQLQLPTRSLGEILPNPSSSVSTPNEDQSSISEPQRQRRRPSWMIDYVSGDELSDEDTTAQFALFAGSDPILFTEAVKEEKWKKAMDAEIEAIEKNKTWELTDLPKGQKTIGVKWVYKTKLNEKGEIDKYKARLVVKGYKQEHGVDYEEVFAPVARQDTIRLVVSLAAQNSWPIFQLDVKSAFLNGELLEQVYIEQPPGYEVKGNEHKVYKLKKALYGLKQAPRAWYSCIEDHFEKAGFNKCPYEHTLFIKSGEGGKILIVCLYVDDLIFTGNDETMFSDFKSSMMADFDMTDLGKMKYFLGIEVVQTGAGLFLGQKKYAQEVLERFHMENCNPVGTPTEPGLKLSSDHDGERVDSTYFKQIVGSLMYLTTTRPDIMYAVCVISRYMERPTELHLKVAKRVFRYLKGTTDFGIFYKKNGESVLTGFTDSDYAGDLDDRRSTSGNVFMMGSAAVSWASKKQQVVTLSTTEAEFIAAANSACQAIWLRRILEELHFHQDRPTVIHCDNSSTIKLSKNPVLHGRSKHIDVRFHFLRDLVTDKTIDLVYCQSEDRVADIMTKSLKLEAFVKLRGLLGVCSSLVLN